MPGPVLLAALLMAACADGDRQADTGPSGGPPGTDLADSDGDTLLDVHEGSDDVDADGVGNHLDLDSDGDGVLDRLEAGDTDVETLPRDADRDGTPDFLDLDSDNNCISDRDEGPADHEPLLDHDAGTEDADGVPDLADLDDDGDGILDVQEGQVGGCGDVDSNGDGQVDRLDSDSDGDGIPDAEEAGEDGPIDTDGDGIPDFRDLDSDGDGLLDFDEGGSDFGSRDTDGDGLADHVDLDSDGDGLSDREEASLYLTDPVDADSDDDGVPDGGEIFIGTNPSDAEDVLDGVYVEILPRTTQELEVPVAVKVQRADVAFLLDTTSSMVDESSALTSAFSEIVSRLSATVPDIAFGYATFEDYRMSSIGTDIFGAKPFRLQQQITSQQSLVQTALANTEHHAGGYAPDYPESSIEAVYQALGGVGYDTDCNTVYDSNADVRPFLASAEDPFGGLGGQSWTSGTPDGGELGGMGFRDRALPIVIYAADDELKDGDDVGRWELPGGCPSDGGSDDVVRAAAELGAYIIGVCSAGVGDCRPQMESLAVATGSLADIDGDGAVDEPLVFDWETGSDDTTELLAGAVEDLVSSLQFDELAVRVEEDPQGFVTDILPAQLDVRALDEDTEEVTFVVSLLGAQPNDEGSQYYTAVLGAWGDEELFVDEITLLFRVLRP